MDERRQRRHLVAVRLRRLDGPADSRCDGDWRRWRDVMASHARDGAFQTSDGSTIAFTVHRAPRPDAPRMALIHSLALDRSVWDGVVSIVAPEAELLTYDCRGHGRSDHRATAFTAERFARALRELLHHVGWQSAAIGGCSMGGCDAMAFAGVYPESVTGL